MARQQVIRIGEHQIDALFGGMTIATRRAKQEREDAWTAEAQSYAADVEIVACAGCGRDVGNPDNAEEVFCPECILFSCPDCGATCQDDCTCPITPGAAFEAAMWGWLTPEHAAIAERERRTGEIPVA